MDDARLTTKRDNAITVLNHLMAFLDAHGLNYWTPRFDEIVGALRRNDYQTAIALEDAIPRVNMGSFGDFYVDSVGDETDTEADQQFRKLNGFAQNSITNIRLYLNYKIDRPLINV